MLRNNTTLCMALLSLATYAQSADPSALNDTYAGRLQFKVDKHQRLVIEHFEDGSRYRQDIVPINDLDVEQIAFSPEEKAVSLRCRTDKPQCISKEIFKLDVVRVTSRVTVPTVATDHDGQRTIALFKDFSRSAEVAEQHGTSEAPVRKSERNTRTEP